MTQAKGAAAGGPNLVGPIVQAGEIAEAVIEAVKEDNPGRTVVVQERASYVRIGVDGECTIRRKTMEQKLGRPFRMQELEVGMSSFAGQIETTTDHMRFYFERKL